MNGGVTRSKTLFMLKSPIPPSLTLATLLLGGCVYVPPPGPYGGPPPPPDVPPPYHLEEPPPRDFYFGRGKSRRDYEMQFSYRPRGRTHYLREVDPDYVVEDPVEGPADEAMSPEDQSPDPAPAPSESPAEPPPPPPAPKIDPNTVPYATKTNTPGRAKSPYPPYRELDVSGMRSGSMAKDPTTGKVFRVP